jgi:uncharacterized damage-inducible protein DinB
MTSEQGAFLLQSIFLPVYTAEHPVTKAIIAAIPPDKADYRPDSIARNAIDLAWHIVVAEDRFMKAVAAGGFTFDNASPPEAIRTPADIVAWYSERFAANIERLRTTSADALVVPVDFRGLFTFPAVVFLQSGQGAIDLRREL